MPKHLYDGWCDCKAKSISNGRRLHVITEINGARPKAHGKIVETVLSHYEDPRFLAERIKRHGFKKAARVLEEILPKTKKTGRDTSGKFSPPKPFPQYCRILRFRLSASVGSTGESPRCAPKI